MRIPFSIGTHERTRGNPPPLRLINMFAEKTPTASGQVQLVSRLGLSRELEVGPGPVRGTFQKDGLDSGSKFVVSGAALYRGTTFLGLIDGDGPVSFASSDTELLVAAGGNLWSWAGSTLQAVTMPFTDGVTAVAHIDGYFIALRKGTGEWYFSAVLDGRSWDALDFATAESEPDRLLDVIPFNDTLIFAGTETIEFWVKTGDAALPYTPVQQRVLQQGCAATGCLVQEDNTFFWIGRDRIVYRYGEVPLAIADDAIVEAAADSADVRLFEMFDGRHKFICLRTDSATHAYDITSGEWTELQSYGRTNFRCGPGMGDDEDGIVWEFDGFDDDGGQHVRQFTAGTELDAPAFLNNLRLNCEIGTTGYLSGTYADPQLEMRMSRDYGNIWTEWEGISLGGAGDYTVRPMWHALGMVNFPGVLFQFRIAAPVSFRVTSVAVNEPLGGI